MDKSLKNEGLLCPVCRRCSFEEKGGYEICPVCGWEDDPVQRKDPDFAGGANKLSLNKAREEWLKQLYLETDDYEEDAE